MNSITPHVSSTEEIINYPQVKNGATEVIGMPIISEIGPITPVIVNNRQLLNLFTKNGIKRSSNISLKLASILSKSANLLVCRVTNTEVLPAVAIGYTLTPADPGDTESEDTYTKLVTYAYYKDGVYYSDAACTTELISTETNHYALMVHSYDPNPTYQGLNFRKVSGKLQIGLSTGLDEITGTNKVYSYNQFSLDVNAVDGFGTSLYLENLNTTQSQYNFKVTENVVDTTILDTMFDSAVAFWNNPTDLPYNTTLSSDNSPYMNGNLTNVTIAGYVVNALNKISRYRRDLKMPILFDGGLFESSATIINNIEKIAKKRKSLGVFSTPIELNTFTKIKNYYSLTSIRNLLVTNDKLSSYLFTATPYRTYDSFGFAQKLPITLEYILTYLSNKASNMEFAPIFGKKTGRISGNNIGISFYHSTDPEEIAIEDTAANADEIPETEQLQRLSVNPAIYDESVGFSYLVNNLTYQEPNLNNLSEENNRRFFNSIQFDVNRLLDDMIAKANNAITREELANMLDNYRENTLNKLGYGLNKDLNDGNNGFRYDIEPYDPSRRNLLKLSVDVCFNDSIKYVNVIYRDIPVVAA